MIFQDDDLEDVSMFFNVLNRLQNIYRKRMDKYIVHFKERWIIAMALFILFLLRIIYIGGYYVVSYILGLHLLQSLIQFLTPLGVPDLDDLENEDFPDIETLPTTLTQDQNNDSQARPLLRTISEFSLWQNSMIALMMAYLCTFTRLLDLPVYWPFLLIYFIVLVFIAMRKYTRHQQKYKYSMGDFSKKNNK